MRRPSLRSQLNQIRLWVRQGRTDAWIAHKLDVTVEQLEQFKRDHRLDEEAEPARSGVLSFDSGLLEADLEDELDLEVREEDEDEEEEEEEEGEPADLDERDEDDQRAESERAGRRRRRGRRGGRRRGRSATPSFEGTFEQGDEGYGLWLDPAVADTPVYTEHWAGHRDVTVTVEPDSITIRRAGSDG